MTPGTAGTEATGADIDIDIDIDNDEYLAAMADFKRRRMRGLAALCGLLLVPLVVIYTKHWWNVNPAHPVGRGWVFVGIAVTVCAIGAVLADVLYRKEL